MSKLVVDSSVAIKWFVAEVDEQKARDIHTAHRSGKVSLLAPDLLYTEVGNILWKKHRQGALTVIEARQKLTALQAVSIITTPDLELMDDAFRLAMQHQRSVYDSLYLALSLREDCPFVTADERLANAVRTSVPNVVLLSATAY